MYHWEWCKWGTPTLPLGAWIQVVYLLETEHSVKVGICYILENVPHLHRVSTIMCAFLKYHYITLSVQLPSWAANDKITWPLCSEFTAAPLLLWSPLWCYVGSQAGAWIGMLAVAMQPGKKSSYLNCISSRRINLRWKGSKLTCHQVAAWFSQGKVLYQGLTLDLCYWQIKYKVEQEKV